MEKWGRRINSEKLLQREKDSMYDICIGKAAGAGFEKKKGDGGVCCSFPHRGRMSTDIQGKLPWEH